VRFTCTEPGAATFAELRAEQVVAATLNGRALEPSAYDGTRIVLDDLAADNELVVDAEIPYTSTGDGMHRYVDPLDGEAYVGAYVGVVNAQRVFASFDQPDLKATIRTTVTAPTGWTVVGNGLAQTGDPGTGRWELAATPRVSPYLFVLVAGPLHEVRATHRGLQFGLYCRRSLAEHLDREAAEILEVTTACFDHYTSVFDAPYPFDKYDQAFVPELNWGALEQVGCILFRDEYVFTSAVTDEQRVGRANTIAHEMAHMWFGDLVTLGWWEDIWLNESFAEYMGAQVVEQATRFPGAWTAFAASREPWGYDADERSSTHPVAPDEADVLDTETALENFDGISYAKGAAALRQLVAWLGEETFLAGINDLLTARSFGTATLADVLDALARHSGRDVHAWADAWLRTTGVDTLRVERTADGAHVEHPGVRPHLVRVGLYDARDGDLADLVLRRAVDVRLPAAPGPVPVDLGAEPAPDLLLLNDGDLTYAKVRLDPRSTEALAAGLSSIADPVARAVAWGSLRDRVRDAELAPLEHVALVARHLPPETDATVADGVLSWSRDVLADRYLGAADRDRALEALGAACADLLVRTDEATSPSLRLTALRWYVASTSRVDELRDWLGDGVPGGPALDDDLRWRLLRRLTVLGAVDGAEIDAALAQSPGEESALHAAWCRAARPADDAKQQAWALMFDDVPEEQAASAYVVRATAAGFWRPEQRDLLAPYVEPWFPAARATAARRGSAVNDAIVWAGFPWHDVDEATLRLAEAAVADTATTAMTRRRLSDQIDEYRRALRIRAAGAGSATA
jgi:aminopeptidase N